MVELVPLVENVDKYRVREQLIEPSDDINRDD
jgi:hypothetical protein